MLWKSYIDFEIEQEEYEKTRNLYRRLLQRTQHVKVCVGSRATEPALSLAQGRESLAQGRESLGCLGSLCPGPGLCLCSAGWREAPEFHTATGLSQVKEAFPSSLRVLLKHCKEHCDFPVWLLTKLTQIPHGFKQPQETEPRALLCPAV